VLKLSGVYIVWDILVWSAVGRREAADVVVAEAGMESMMEEVGKVQTVAATVDLVVVSLVLVDIAAVVEVPQGIGFHY
jgi:hypothetical protein